MKISNSRVFFHFLTERKKKISLFKKFVYFFTIIVTGGKVDSYRSELHSEVCRDRNVSAILVIQLIFVMESGSKAIRLCIPKTITRDTLPSISPL